jgi:hypothetical protein
VLQPPPVTLDLVVSRADAQQYISPNLRGFIERMNSGRGGYFIDDSALRQNESKLFSNVPESRAPGLELFRSATASTRRLAATVGRRRSAKFFKDARVRTESRSCTARKCHIDAASPSVSMPCSCSIRRKYLHVRPRPT